MNIKTINYIVRIAGFAADQLASGKTLKASKLWLADAMSAETTPYSNVEGVDFDVVNSRHSLNEAVNARTKAIFANQCKGAVNSANSERCESVMAFRAAHAIRIAQRDHNVTLTEAQVIEWANGDEHFNFTKAAHALAHATKEAAPATVTGLTIRIGQTIEGTDGRPVVIDHITGGAGYRVANGKAYGQHAHVSFDVTDGHQCPRYGVASVRLLADVVVTPELIEKHHDEAIAFDAHLNACQLENAGREGWTVWGEAKGVLAADQRRKALDAAHAEALQIDRQMHQDDFYSASSMMQGVWINLNHAEALRMDDDFDGTIRDGLTPEQRAIHNSRMGIDIYGEGFKARLAADHDEALETEAVRNRAIADNAIELNTPESVRNRQYLWENTWSEEYRAYRLEAARAEAFEMNEASTAANTDIIVPLRIISDYMQRFMRSNKDAKLFEAKERLESKIVVFVADGYDEQCLRQALSTATSSHTWEAFAAAFSGEA